jgi:molecular chaperone GrpE
MLEWTKMDLDKEKVEEQENAEVTENKIDMKDEEIEKLKASVTAAQDSFLRAHAETENVRRRAAKELEEAQKYSIVKFARELLEVSENLHRAIACIPDDISNYDERIKAFVQGIQMTLTSLESAFEKQGITRIYPLNSKFDHNYHQAIGHVEDQTQEPNTIITVVRAGYVIKDRLLQPALVMLSKH